MFQSILLCILSLFIVRIESHGRLVDPPARASMWRYGFQTTHREYTDNQIFCGGFSRQHNNENKGKCGPCGDAYDLPPPRQNENTGKYGEGIITRVYDQGDTIPVKVEITASHMGWFEFRLCNLLDRTKPETLDCFKYLLPDKTGKTRFEEGGAVKTHEFSLVLPPEVVCEQCVVQWKYHTANSWGQDENGAGLGYGAQEEFYGCSDVAIKSKGSGSNLTPTTAKLLEKTTKLTTTTAEVRTKNTETKVTTVSQSQTPATETAKETTTPARKEDTTTPVKKATTTPPLLPPQTGDRISNAEAVKRKDTECIATGPWKSQQTMDTWCHNNCFAAAPNCPESHCECYIKGDAEAKLPPPTSGPCLKYVATGSYVNDITMDTFCQFTCQKGNASCPLDICTCDYGVQSLKCSGKKLLQNVVGFGAFCETLCTKTYCHEYCNCVID